MSSKITIKPSGFKYLIAALVILLIVYSFKLNSDYKKLEDAFSEQKIELQAELDEIIEDYKNVNVKNKDLSQRLVKEINKIILLRDSIKNLEKSNYNLIVKYSRKIVKLERENRRLFIQVDSLNKQNYELLQENIVVKQQLDENEEFSEKLTRKMGEIGLFGMFVSDEYEGQAMDYISYIIAVEEIARVDGSQAATIAAGNSLGIGPLNYFGTEEQKRKYLPKLCSGEYLYKVSWIL